MFTGIFTSNVSLFNYIYVAVAGVSIILSAVYTLNMIQRVFFGELSPAMVTVTDIRLNERVALGILAADVHVHALAPGTSVANAAAIVGHKHHVALLQQVLVDAGIHRVVPLHMPAVVVLVHAVAVNPHNGRVLAQGYRLAGGKEQIKKQIGPATERGKWDLKKLIDKER